MTRVVFFVITITLTNIVVMATGQCYRHTFQSPFYPGNSCEEIYDKNPESHQWSGYYWIFHDGLPVKVFCGMNYTGLSCEDIHNNNPETGGKSGYYRINDTVWTYCNMTETSSESNLPSICTAVGGEWTRVVNIDISAGDSCPSGWLQDSDSGVSFCAGEENPVNGANSCYSSNFMTNGMSYHRVCGRAKGYQKGTTRGFSNTNQKSFTLNQAYADALSLTYNNDSSRQHIWTYTAGIQRNGNPPSGGCPCANTQLNNNASEFVDPHYYCDSGTVSSAAGFTYYLDDVLWDVDSCNTMPVHEPWFYRELSGTTTSDIEGRLCSSDGYFYSGVIIEELELYIQ